MPNTPDNPKVALSDITDVVSTPVDGRLPLIVGGQAVNAWAVFYSKRLGNRLAPYMPFVSKDLDLFGSVELLEALAKRYGVTAKYSPPRNPGVGQLLIPQGKLLLKVEVFSNLYGIRRVTEDQGVRIDVHDKTIRVLDPVTCLRSKIANVAGLDQTDRQDVRHVHILKLCTREYVKDVLEGLARREKAGLDSSLDQRGAVNLLEDLRETLIGQNVQTASRKWGLSFAEVMPTEEIAQSPLEKVRNFAKYRLLTEAPKIAPTYSPYPPAPRHRPGHGHGFRL